MCRRRDVVAPRNGLLMEKADGHVQALVYPREDGSRCRKQCAKADTTSGAREDLAKITYGI